MEEISANNILYLYNNDEAKFHKAIDRIVNGKNEKAKQGLRKYIDYLNNIIKKIWNFLSGKSAQERAKYQPELNEITRLRDMFESAFAKAVENRKTLNSNQNQTNGTDKEFSLKVAKKKGTWYNEYQTNALSWARSTERQVGDVTILNANGKYFALIEATDDGFIELVKGNYQEVSAEYERIHVEKDTSFYEDTQEIRTERNSDMWDLQYVEDGGNASGNGQPVGSERLQTDTTGNNEHLRSGDKGKSFSLKQVGDNNYSNEFIENTVKSFGIQKIGDYIHVQRQVLDTLVKENFFTDSEKRSRVDVNKDSGMIIETNKSGIDETFNLKNFARLGKNKKITKLATIKMLPEIIEKGRLIADNVPNQYGDSTNKKFAYIEYTCKVDEKPVTIRLDIKKSPQKNKFWMHRVMEKENVSNFPASTESGAEAGYTKADTDKTISHSEPKVKSFSLKEKWHPDLTRQQVKMVEGWLREEGSPESTRITDTANWYMGRISGQDLFAIYSNEDAKGPTILYESKGKQAKIEKDILMDLLEEIENGKSANGKSAYVNWVFSGGWMRQRNSIRHNISRLGSGQNNQNAGVLPGQPQGNPSAAFENVIRNIFKIQERHGNKEHSLKGTVVDGEIASLVKKYGTIPKGENPARDIDVPRKTADGRKVSHTVRTILEAKATPDEALPSISELVTKGEFSYDAYTDKEAIAEAEETITKKGWEQAKADWYKAVGKGEATIWGRTFFGIIY